MKKAIIKHIKSIQTFLDECTYNTRDFARCAQYVSEKKRAHCLEGALYAAVKLEELKITPYLLDFRAIDDDDHVVCIYKLNGKWGAIGKSSTALLRGRDPVFSTIDKLAMSYFPFYFNKKGKLSLHQWSGPVPMKYFKKIDWRHGKGNMQQLAWLMNELPAKTVVSKKELLTLPKVSKDLWLACFHVH
ncbi:MAG: hypothetical protein QE271_13410 [Bacteriovoracaceae bacterium]|nr:hypothetical protein [Bacteriovoracaceae bacterium]